jgi:hypothetical protein
MIKQMIKKSLMLTIASCDAVPKSFHISCYPFTVNKIFPSTQVRLYEGSALFSLFLVNLAESVVLRFSTCYSWDGNAID